MYISRWKGFLQNSFVYCARLTLPFLRTLRFSKKECPSESLTGHQLDTSAAAKFPTMSTPSVLAIGLRVLIVEDHLANRILLEAMVNKSSNQDVCYEIETVEDGLEAVQVPITSFSWTAVCRLWMVGRLEFLRDTERQTDCKNVLCQHPAFPQVVMYVWSWGSIPVCEPSACVQNWYRIFNRQRWK